MGNLPRFLHQIQLLLCLTIWITVSLTSAQKSYFCDMTYTDTISHQAKCNTYIKQVMDGYLLDAGNMTEYELISAISSNETSCSFSKEVEAVKQVCCAGYSGDQCNIPVCSPECANGACISPANCVCDDGYSGELCDEQANLVTELSRYCYKSDDCKGEKQNEIGTNLTSLFNCCVYGSSWGVQDEECKVCTGSEQALTYSTELAQNAHSTYRTCRNHGISSFKTFDGLMYLYPVQASCEYHLALHDHSFSVSVQPLGCEAPSTCTKKLLISVSGRNGLKTIAEIHEHNIVVDGESVTLDKSDFVWERVGAAFTISLIGEYLLLESVDRGIRIKADRYSDVVVEVDITEENNGKLSGLCGNSDGYSNNDMIDKNDEITTNTALFGNAQISRTSSTLTCSESSSFISACIHQDDISAAEEACSLMKSEIFADCRKKVNINTLYEACKSDFCKATTEEQKKAVRCSKIEDFSRYCADVGTIVNWKIYSTECQTTCDVTESYGVCSTKCMKTCANFFKVVSPDCQEGGCFPGCFCSGSTVLQNGECINPEDCACIHHDMQYTSGSVLVIDCNQCKCLSGMWSCTNNKCSAECQIFGFSHVRTFDGLAYMFNPDSCYYDVLELKSGVTDPSLYLRIRLHHELCFGFDVNFYCASKLEIVSKREKMLLRNKFSSSTESTIEVIINNLDYSDALPYEANTRDLYVKQATSQFVIVHGLGFQIMFGNDNRLYIKLFPSFLNKVQGLCGTYNQKSGDDKRGPDGIDQPNVEDFVAEYRDPLCVQPQHSNRRTCGTDAEFEEAEKFCEKLKDAQLFGACIAAMDDALSWYTDCITDVCNSPRELSKDAVCVVAADFAKTCAKKGFLIDWRSSLVDEISSEPLCKSPCDGIGGETYTECASACEGHCRDFSISHTKCEDGCIAGCTCPYGLFLDEYNTCVPQTQCTCYDRHGIDKKIYNPGDRITQTCKECECVNGSWLCDVNNCEETVICPKNQIYLSDVSACRSTCSTVARISADLVCQSPILFRGCGCPDNETLAPDGRCVDPKDCPCEYGGRYYQSGEEIEIHQHECKVMRCIDHVWMPVRQWECPGICWASGDPHYESFDGKAFSFQGSCQYIMTRAIDNSFSIESENVACGTSGVTCTKSIHIRFGDNKVIHLVRGHELTVQDEVISANEYMDDDIVIFKSGLMMTNVYLRKLGVMIEWDAGTRVKVILNTYWKKKVEGLCGNFDGLDVNDFQLSSGSTQALTAIEFGNAWRTTDTCSHVTPPDDPAEQIPCGSGTGPSRKHWAEEACSVISSQGDFKECYDAMQSETRDRYYAQCLVDACSCDQGGDCECLCEAIANFHDACIKLGYPVKWRHQRLCPIQCENGMEYLSCGPACPQTCRNAGAEPEDYCKDSFCREGCFCPVGFVNEDGECIPADDCTCLRDGYEYPADTIIFDNCKNCTCYKGVFECVGEDCVCEDFQFQCNSSISLECIDKQYVCDRISDCTNGEDEVDCAHGCAEDYFECDLGYTCYSEAQECDGVADCGDETDELNCPLPECSDNEFQCDTGVCIPESYVCDGTEDCGVIDISDEENCNAQTTINATGIVSTSKETPRLSSLSPPTRPIITVPSWTIFTTQPITTVTPESTTHPPPCSTGEIKCIEFDGCIPQEKLCDGICDCSFGYESCSDENHPTCKKSVCLSEETLILGCTILGVPYECILTSMMCDGVSTCDFEEDEQNCEVGKPALMKKYRPPLNLVARN